MYYQYICICMCICICIHILYWGWLRNSASSFHWLSSSIFNVRRLFVCPASVTPPLISTIWCFRPYKTYIFCEDMILATCQCQHILCVYCWVEPSLLLSSSWKHISCKFWVSWWISLQMNLRYTGHLRGEAWQGRGGCVLWGFRFNNEPTLVHINVKPTLRPLRSPYPWFISLAQDQFDRKSNKFFFSLSENHILSSFSYQQNHLHSCFAGFFGSTQVTQSES